MYNDIGEIIAARRKALGLSQSELAEILCGGGIDVTNQAVSKWEKNSTEIVWKSLMKYLKEVIQEYLMKQKIECILLRL